MDQTRTDSLDRRPVQDDGALLFAPRSISDACREIEEILDELGRLAASEATAEQFHTTLAEQALRETGAWACGIWLHEICAFEAAAPEAANVVGYAASRKQLVLAVIATGKAIIQPIEAYNHERDENALAVAVPISVESQTAGVIELLFSADVSKATQARALAIAEALSEIGGDYYRHRQIAQYHKRERHWTSFAKFIERIDRATMEQTAVAIACEGRWFIGCDRVSVIKAGTATPRVIAVSGVDRADARSNLLSSMRELSSAVLKFNEPVWQVERATVHAPQIEEPLQAFLEQSHSRAAIAIPVGPSRSIAGNETQQSGNEGDPPIGVFLIEWFTVPSLDDVARERVDLFALHGGRALARAAVTERLPLIRVGRALDKIAWLAKARRIRAARWAIVAVAVIVAALLLIPANFDIAADGELLPAERREIFSPAQGVVESLVVEHGDEINAGQPLLQLRSPALDYEIARVQGELQTAEKRLSAIRAARFERNPDPRGGADRYLQLTSEEEEIGETCKSLHQQEQLLTRQRAELEVQSPIAGRVLTWDVNRSLLARPVERGQPLLSIGNVAGPWSLEVQVPDEQIGYVLDAADAARREQRALDVYFLLIAEPDRTYQGTVERMALRSSVPEHGGRPTVLVTIRAMEPINNPRAGAGVVAKIDCGKRSLGFVWLHNAWNSIRRCLLF